jgi:hypothetical protein
MKIIITEEQSGVINNIINGVVISEAWSQKQVNDIIQPTERPSKADTSKGLYRKMIEKLLMDNQSSLNEIGVENRNGHYFIKGTDNGSPLSYMNTHYGVARLFANYFNVPSDATKEEAVEIIGNGLQREFNDIFITGNELTKEIYDALGHSKTQGDKNEIIAKNYILYRHKDQIKSVDIVAGTGGALDKSGVDIVVTLNNGRKINYQVKPFLYYGVSDDGNAIIYGVKGRTPVYPHHHYWIFVNDNKVLEVRSKNLKAGVRQRDVMFLPSEDVVSKSDNLKPWVRKIKEE